MKGYSLLLSSFFYFFAIWKLQSNLYTMWPCGSASTGFRNRYQSNEDSIQLERRWLQPQDICQFTLFLRCYTAANFERRIAFQSAFHSQWRSSQEILLLSQPFRFVSLAVCTKTVFKCDMLSKGTRCVGRRPMLSPEQKPMTLISHLLIQFTQLGAIVLGQCLGTRATSNDFFYFRNTKNL